MECDGSRLDRASGEMSGAWHLPGHRTVLSGRSFETVMRLNQGLRINKLMCACHVPWG